MRRPIAPVGLFEGYVLRSVSDASEVAPAPLVAGAHAWRLTVPAEWIDYNGHMSEARYLQAASLTTDALLALHGC